MLKQIIKFETSDGYFELTPDGKRIILQLGSRPSPVELRKARRQLKRYAIK